MSVNEPLNHMRYTECYCSNRQSLRYYKINETRNQLFYFYPSVLLHKLHIDPMRKRLRKISCKQLKFYLFISLGFNVSSKKNHSSMHKYLSDLRSSQTIYFHGFNVMYIFISLPYGVDCILFQCKSHRRIKRHYRCMPFITDLCVP